jgi:hypothetical protein
MPFEKFTQTGQRFNPKISIWEGGQIGFNQGAITRYNLENYKFAILFFDRENKRIGIKFTNNEKEEGIIKFNQRKTGGVISGKAFLDYYDINYSQTIKNLDIFFDKENEIYVVNLE